MGGATVPRGSRPDQEIYGRDEATGAGCGIYFFESREALAAYRDTELARSIPEAYEATEVRADAYELVFPLYDDRGPLPTPDRPAGGDG